MRKCKSCNETKPLTEYSKDKNLRGGIKPNCKKCESLRRRKIPYQEIVAFDFYE
jgi:NAD-dependent SIR2 family protein deacetylase